MANITYLTVADHVNLHPYSVLIPAFYDPNSPEEYLSGEIIPHYNPIIPEAPVLSKLAIKYMIDMHSSAIQFAIRNDKDVLEIFHTLDNYLVECTELINQLHIPTIRYAIKVINFRQKFYKVFRKVVHRNTDWRDAYIKGEESVRFLLDFMFLHNGFKQFEHPVEALQTPPFSVHDLEQLLNPEKEDKVTTDGAFTIEKDGSVRRAFSIV